MKDFHRFLLNKDATKRPKIKRAPNKPKKHGFPTNQAEIKGFIE